MKNVSANAGAPGEKGSIPGSRRSPGEGSGSPLQYSCLGDPRDRGAWRATVHRVTELDMAERLRTLLLLSRFSHVCILEHLLLLLLSRFSRVRLCVTP